MFIKTHSQRNLLSIFLICATSYLLTSCEEEPPKQKESPKYGNIVNYLNSVSLDYPDFSLRFLEKKTTQSKAAGDTIIYTFHLADGIHYREVEWTDASHRMVSFEKFTVNEKPYYIELISSNFLDTSLKDGELIVWTDDQYKAHQKIISAAALKVHQKMIAHIPKYDPTDPTQPPGPVLFALYRDYMHIINDGNEEFIDHYLSIPPAYQQGSVSERSDARNKRISPLFSRTNPQWNTLSAKQMTQSPKRTKLYMEGKSTMGRLIIGVTFVQQGRDWKIESDRIVRDDAKGRQWITQFLKPE
jgi:hypothetical protein